MNEKFWTLVPFKLVWDLDSQSRHKRNTQQKLESGKLECWKSQGFFRKLEVKIQAPEVERRKLFFKFWKLDVWASHLNTFSAQKRAKKREKTAVFKRGNLLEDTPVETRGDP